MTSPNCLKFLSKSKNGLKKNVTSWKKNWRQLREPKLLELSLTKRRRLMRFRPKARQNSKNKTFSLRSLRNNWRTCMPKTKVKSLKLLSSKSWSLVFKEKIVICRRKLKSLVKLLTKQLLWKKSWLWWSSNWRNVLLSSTKCQLSTRKSKQSAKSCSMSLKTWREKYVFTVESDPSQSVSWMILKRVRNVTWKQTKCRSQLEVSVGVAVPKITTSTQFSIRIQLKMRFLKIVTAWFKVLSMVTTSASSHTDRPVQVKLLLSKVMRIILV